MDETIYKLIQQRRDSDNSSMVNIPQITYRYRQRQGVLHLSTRFYFWQESSN
jgi:hypothetical protein